LVTSTQCFKFMVMYSMIQFFTVSLLGDAFANLSNNQYLWIDLVIIMPIALLMGYTKPIEGLSKYRPASNLMSFPVLASTIGQMIIQFSFQVIKKNENFFEILLIFFIFINLLNFKIHKIQ